MEVMVMIVDDVDNVEMLVMILDRTRERERVSHLRFVYLIYMWRVDIV